MGSGDFMRSDIMNPGGQKRTWKRRTQTLLAAPLYLEWSQFAIFGTDHIFVRQPLTHHHGLQFLVPTLRVGTRPGRLRAPQRAQ